MSTFNFTKFRYFDGNGHELPLVYGGDIELRIKNTESPKNFTSYLLATSSPDASVDLTSAAMNTSLFKMITGCKYNINEETDVIYVDSSIDGSVANSDMRLMNTENNHYFDVNGYASSNGTEYYPEIVYNNIPSSSKELFLSAMEIDSSILKFPSLTFNTKINFNRVSTGLVETQTIYILTETEDAYNSEYGLHGMVDVSTYADIEAGKGNFDPTDYINRFQLMFFIDCRKQKDFRFFTLDGDSVVWSDRHFVDFRDGRIDLTFKNGFRVDVGFVGEEEGVYEQDMYVCVIDTSTAHSGYPGDSYPIGVIHMTAETEGKDERYDTLFTNFGLPKIDTFDDVFKDSEVFNDSPDYISMNKHAKKVFLTYSEIFPYVGTYKALFNAVKMLGYDDIFFKEWYKDIGNGINEDNGYITYAIDPSSAIIPSQMYGSTVDDRIHIKKMNWLSMMYRINEELEIPDDKWGFPTSIPNINYYNTGSIVKLISLKAWLEKYITGINCRITDISGEGVVFERYALAKYGSYQQVLEYNNERPVGLKVLNETEILEDCSANIHVALKTADSDLSIESFGNRRLIDFCVGYFDANCYYHEGSGDETDDSSIIYFSRCMDMNDNMNTFELRANGVHETFRFENDGSILSTHGASLLVDDNEIFFDPHDSARSPLTLLCNKQRNSAFVSLPVIVEYTKDYVSEKTTSKTYIPPFCENGNTVGAIKIDASDNISSYTVKKRILGDDSSCVATIYKTTDGSYGETDVSLAVNEQRTYGLRFCIDKNGTPCFRTLYYTCVENDGGDIDGSDTSIPDNRKYEKYLKLGYPIDSSYVDSSGYFYSEKKDVNGHLIFNDPKHNRRIILIVDYDRENDERKIHVETITYSDVFTLLRYNTGVNHYYPFENIYVNRFTHGKEYSYFCEHYLDSNTIDSAVQCCSDDIPINVLNSGTYTIEVIMMDEYNNMFGATSSKTVRVLPPEIGIKIFAHDEHSNNSRNDSGVRVDIGQWSERSQYEGGENASPIYKYVPKYQIADASCFYDRYIKLDSSNTIEERYMKKTSMCEISDLTYRVKYYGCYTDSSGYYYIFTDEHKDSDGVYGAKFAKTDNDVSTCISIDVSTSVTYNSPDTSILHAFAKHYYDSSEGTLLDMTLVSYDTVSNTPYYSRPSIVKKCDSLNMYIIRSLVTNYYDASSGYDAMIEHCKNENYDYYLFPSWAIKVNNDSSNINNILYNSIFPYDCSIFDNNVMKLAFTDSSYYGYRSIRCKSLEDGSGLKTDASLYIDNDCSLYLLPKEWNYSSRVFNLDSATDMRKRNIYIEDSAVNRDYLYYVDGTNAVSCRDFDINYATSFVNTDGIMDVSLNVYQYNNTIRTHYDEVAVAVDVDGIIEYYPSMYQLYDITPRWKLYTHDNDTSRKLLIESFNRILAIKPLELSSYDIELAMFDRHGNKYEKILNGAFGKLSLKLIYYKLEYGTLPNNGWILNNTYVQFNGFDDVTYTGFLALKERITELGNDNPFSNCINLIYVDLLNADSLITIGDGAFENCNILKKIILPETIETIGDNAFANCTLLKEIILPETLETIGNGSFKNCCSLEYVEFPSLLTSIGDEAYMGCNGIEYIELPKSITSIGECAFNDCSVLNLVICNALTPPQLSDNNFDVPVDRLVVLYDYMQLYEDDENWSSVFSSIEAFRVEYKCNIQMDNQWINRQEWITYSTYDNNNGLGVLYLKHRMDDFGGVGSLDARRFELDLSNSFVKNINGIIVERVDGMAKLILPHTVKAIGDVFRQYYNQYTYTPTLDCVQFNGSIKQWCDISFYNQTSNPLQYAASFIYGYDGEYNNELVFTDDITEIKEYAFYGANMIKYIKHGTSYGFPDSIERIRTKAFYNDYNLGIETVIIPETTSEIAVDAFYNVKHIIRIGDNTADTWGALYKNGYINNYIVYDSSVDGNRNIYAADTSIRGNIDIDGDDVKNIYRYAFYMCKSINTINIDMDGNSKFSYPRNRIYNYAFGDVNAIKVDDVYYQMCQSHYTVYLPQENWGARYRNASVVYDMLYSSDYSILIQCINSVVPDASILSCCKIIQNGAFTNHNYIKRFHFIEENNSTYQITEDSSLTRIESGAFAGCSSLEDIIIPSDITYIGGGAFVGCTSLSNVYFNAVDCTYMGAQSNTAFSDCGTDASIHIDENVTKIPNYAFYGLNGILCASSQNNSTEHILNSIIRIGDYAFGNCNAIGDLIIRSDINYIGRYAFYGCDGITKVIIDSLNTPNDASIGNNAFGKCPNITEMELPFIGNKKLQAYGTSASCFGYIFNNNPEDDEHYYEAKQYFGSNNNAYHKYYIPLSLHKLTVNNNVIRDALSSCSSLTDITINGRPEESALNYCDGLVNLRIDNINYNLSGQSNSLIGYIFGTRGGSIHQKYGTNNLDYTARIPSTLRKVVFNNQEKLGSSAFYGCNMIENVEVNGYDSGTGIWPKVFYGCTNLRTVKINGSSQPSYRNVGDNAFENCTNLECVNLISTNTDDSLYCAGSIGKNAFKNCNSLSKVYLNGMAVGNYAFSGCNNLSDVYITNDIVHPNELGSDNFAISGDTLHILDASTYARFNDTNNEYHNIWQQWRDAFDNVTNS